MAAEAFMIVADRIEAGEEPLDIAADLLKQHEKCVFNGNGYDRLADGREACAESTQELMPSIS